MEEYKKYTYDKLSDGDKSEWFYYILIICIIQMWKFVDKRTKKIFFSKFVFKKVREAAKLAKANYAFF